MTEFDYIEFQTLRDFLYWLIDTMEPGRITGTLMAYQNCYWRCGYLAPDKCYIRKCPETVGGNAIEFDPRTGKIDRANALFAEPQKYYFVILSPRSVKTIDEFCRHAKAHTLALASPQFAGNTGTITKTSVSNGEGGELPDRGEPPKKQKEE